MALRTLGTAATNTLSGFIVGVNDVIAADLATLNVGIRGDPPGYLGPTGGYISTAGIPSGVGTTRPRIAQAYVKKGVLYIPNRGMIQLKDGDFIGFDAT